jgi:hypothetical protein
LGQFHLELAPVGGIPGSCDKTLGFQPRQDPAERLALYMDFCGKLFLVHGTGRNGFEGDDGGSRQAQGCQRLFLTALD